MICQWFGSFPQLFPFTESSTTLKSCFQQFTMAGRMAIVVLYRY